MGRSASAPSQVQILFLYYVKQKTSLMVQKGLFVLVEMTVIAYGDYATVANPVLYPKDIKKGAELKSLLLF